jgi:hypothetical protein
MNVEVGFAADLVTSNLKAAFKLAVNQNETKFKILDENDRRGVVDNVLKAFFALAQRLFRPISLDVLRV